MACRVITFKGIVSDTMKIFIKNSYVPILTVLAMIRVDKGNYRDIVDIEGNTIAIYI